MAGSTLRLTQDYPQALSFSQELFCLEVASGTSAREAAVTAGYRKEYAEQLIKRADIQERIKTLLEDRASEGPGTVIGRAWVEAQLIRIIRDAMNGVQDELDNVTGETIKGIGKDRALARLALMDLAKLRGYVVERKQVRNEKLDWNKVSRAELARLLEEQIGALPPDARAKVKELSEGPVIEGKSATPADGNSDIEV